jgi:hypothetical protein
MAFRTTTVKHPVHGNGCRLEGKNPKLDGTASHTRAFVELLDEEEDAEMAESEQGWHIDHGVPLPEREEY